MSTFTELYEALRNLDTDQVVDECHEETKEALADLNAEQMFKGIRADGSEITPQYSPLTIEIKKEKGQPTDRVTLKDTGAFYSGIRVQVSAEKLEIKSTDWKNDKLNKKYSKSKGNIFGLSEPFQKEYVDEFIGPVFKKKIEEATGLTMK